MRRIAVVLALTLAFGMAQTKVSAADNVWVLAQTVDQHWNSFSARNRYKVRAALRQLGYLGLEAREAAPYLKRKIKSSWHWQSGHRPKVGQHQLVAAIEALGKMGSAAESIIPFLQRKVDLYGNYHWYREQILASRTALRRLQNIHVEQLSFLYSEDTVSTLVRRIERYWDTPSRKDEDKLFASMRVLGTRGHRPKVGRGTGTFGGGHRRAPPGTTRREVGWSGGRARAEFAEQAVPWLIWKIDSQWGTDRRLVAPGKTDKTVSLIQILGDYGPYAAAAVPMLKSKIDQFWNNDSDQDKVMAALQTLGRIGPGAIDAVPLLVHAIDRNWESSNQRDKVMAAIKSLGQIGPDVSVAIPLLANLIDRYWKFDSYLYRVLMARWALKKMGLDAASGEVLHFDEETRKFTLQTILGTKVITVVRETIDLDDVKPGQILTVLSANHNGDVLGVIVTK